MRVVGESGNRYGKLTVIKRVEDIEGRRAAKWLCQCDCGNETVVYGFSLRNGGIKSCGCGQGMKDGEHGTNYVEEVGSRYGKLVVLERVRRSRHLEWLCQCDCGNTKIIRGSNLRTKGTKSCGCLAKFPKGEASFNAVYSGMKNNAKVRGYDFDLTKEQVKEITKQSCFYCGAPPSNVSNRKKMNGEYIYNGIDRVDNTKGYSVENCVPCCGDCNWRKSDRSTEDFMGWVKSVYNHWVAKSEFRR